ncbi:uncharacterized protein M6B38_203460 [Iris pallida]|uniref:Tubulin alpha-6 chain n=1 Tax=Iris pallida TaxID=29817 RepID=A0AAX6E6T3_IRIPA|nr:uncharacterized protein M6B38_203455 [Iris pallida]KAJ6799766.1 uncharacterized protein M6B38_203460 [Iris pallida]
MACFHVARSGFSPAAPLRPGPVRRRSATSPPFGHLRCRIQENGGGGGESNGEEGPESMFMKELRRRGMTPTSLLEEANRGGLFESGEKEEGKEMRVGEGKEENKKRNGVASAEVDKGTADQRVRSMALNSEGLEGLIPRAKVLLTIGGTFFIGFWPLILITFVVFAAVYSYFGPSFVHDGSKTQLSPPPYVDPYALLEDERITPIAPRVN